MGAEKPVIVTADRSFREQKCLELFSQQLGSRVGGNIQSRSNYRTSCWGLCVYSSSPVVSAPQLRDRVKPVGGFSFSVALGSFGGNCSYLWWTQAAASLLEHPTLQLGVPTTELYRSATTPASSDSALSADGFAWRLFGLHRSVFFSIVQVIAQIYISEVFFPNQHFLFMSLITLFPPNFNLLIKIKQTRFLDVNIFNIFLCDYIQSNTEGLPKGSQVSAMTQKSGISLPRICRFEVGHLRCINSVLLRLQ